MKPERVTTRVTTKDFFAMFDVPFQYGGTWTDAADTGPGAGHGHFAQDRTRSCSAARTASAGAIRWNDNEFRIVGVRDHWMPLPTFYDVNNDVLEEPEDVYIPFGWSVALELDSAGNTNGWKPEDIKTYQDFLNSEVIWIQMWAELPDEAARNRFQAFLDNYATEQKRAGRYQRPLNNRLTKVDQWLVDNECRRQRRPRAGRPRLRIPRGVPPEHRRACCWRSS